MTKIYDALRLAEVDRSAGKFAESKAAAAHPKTAAVLPAKTPGAGDLDQIRAILIGDLPGLLQDALDRLGAKINDHSASLRADLEQLEKKLGDRISEIETRAKHGHNDLRDQILSQSKLLTDSIQERSEHVNQISQRRVKDLHEAKLDRADFAHFLHHTAEHFAHSAAGGHDREGGSGDVA
jgi:hypothetical protein